MLSLHTDKFIWIGETPELPDHKHYIAPVATKRPVTANQAKILQYSLKALQQKYHQFAQVNQLWMSYPLLSDLRAALLLKLLLLNYQRPFVVAYHQLLLPLRAEIRLMILQLHPDA